MRFLATFIVFLLLTRCCFGQVDHRKAFQVTLQMARVGEEVIFDQSKGEDYDSLVLVFLGDLKTRKGQHLKILTSRWYWGQSKRATSRIVLFNERMRYLGDYYLTMTYEVPDRIEGQSLVFTNRKGSPCSPNMVTRVSFRNGIPQRFFLRCKARSGDFYSFAPNL